MFMLYYNSAAQNITVRVNSLNDKKEKVVYATTAILSNTDSSLLFTQTSNKETVFFLKNNTAYILKITAVNIKTFYQKLFIGSSDTTLNVVLQTVSKQLSEVVINSRTPLLKHKHK